MPLENGNHLTFTGDALVKMVYRKPDDPTSFIVKLRVEGDEDVLLKVNEEQADEFKSHVDRYVPISITILMMSRVRK